MRGSEYSHAAAVAYPERLEGRSPLSQRNLSQKNISNVFKTSALVFTLSLYSHLLFDIYSMPVLLLLLLLPFYGSGDFVRHYPGEPVPER